jgi:hypothetical protein
MKRLEKLIMGRWNSLASGCLKWCAWFATAALTACAVSRPTTVANPVEAQVAWSEFRLPGKESTRYQWQAKQGLQAWHAVAQRSASAWRKPVRHESERIGDVEFSWWVPALVPNADLTDPDLSDSPVRVMFAFEGDRSRLSMRNRTMFDLAQLLTGEAPPYATLMYVWDPRAPREQVIVNGRTDRVRKIVLESGSENLGRWMHYRRSLRQDFIRAFGEEPGPLVGVALMTDADNTASRAEAWYGDIRIH